jgi:hypothetical protein
MNENTYQFILRNIRRSENLSHFKSVQNMINNIRTTKENEQDLKALRRELRYSLEMRGFTIESLYEETQVQSIYVLETQYENIHLQAL